MPAFLSVPVRFAQKAVLLGVLLGASAIPVVGAGSSASSALRSWVLVEYSLQPPAAVFRSDESLQVVGVGQQFPGSPIRLVALTPQGALLALSSADGRELHLRIERGERIDPGELLDELSASEASSYPLLEPSEAASDGR